MCHNLVTGVEKISDIYFPPCCLLARSGTRGGAMPVRLSLPSVIRCLEQAIFIFLAHILKMFSQRQYQDSLKLILHRT